MTERLSAEQLAEILYLLDRRNYTMGLAARDAMEKLLAELDAVTRERDALSSRLDDFISARATGRSANDD